MSSDEVSGGVLRALRRVTSGIAAMAFARDYGRLITLNAVERPHYGYIVLRAADLARRLGLDRISVLEFGVAGGRGLVNLEQHAERISALTSVRIEVYGFDTGRGLPPPKDYRDLPYIWQENDFAMEEAALRGKLKRALLVLGDIATTIPDFVAKHDPAPVGAIAFDLDYYSSTVDAFRIFSIPESYRLPRIFAYFDDIYSSDLGHVGPRVGVPLAISEFNRDNENLDISPLTHLEFRYAPARAWHRQIFSCADFAHSRFNDFILPQGRQLPL